MSIRAVAQEAAQYLAENKLRLVLAESCTAGLVSASLARVPGISDWLCGSAVTYRDQTKVGWLGVSAGDLAKYTPVSEPVARQMAVGVLARTPEADVAVSITGHLGPDAPPEMDGVLFVGITRRRQAKEKLLGVHRFELKQTTRYRRQQEAAEIVLRCLLKSLR